MRIKRLMVGLVASGVALALGLVALAWGASPASSSVMGHAMHNCPQAGKWAVSVWDGPDDTDIVEALATCYDGPPFADLHVEVVAAYDLDPQAQSWSGYFRDGLQRGKLSKVSHRQALFTLGAMPAVLPLGAPTPTPAPPTPVVTPTPTPTPATQQGTMHNCPQAGKWAVSVWDGPDGTDIVEALATCYDGPLFADFHVEVVAAYDLDPVEQVWRLWVAANGMSIAQGGDISMAQRPDISNLLILDNMQGILTLGQKSVPTPTPTPTLTPTPTATPTPAPTPTPEATPSASPTPSPTPTLTPRPSPTATATPTATRSPTLPP